jgi:DNA-directed RNA polymerase subunit RPC12/RpoP
VRPSDTIVLGAYTMDLRQILAGAMTDHDYAAAFARLRDVYESHSRNKLDMQAKNASRMMMMRFLPGVVLTMVFTAIGLSAGYPYIGFLGAAIGGGIGLFLGSGASRKQVVETAELTRKFQTYYVCPKCKRFFGDVPFEALLNQGSCPSCKSRFQPW